MHDDDDDDDDVDDDRDDDDDDNATFNALHEFANRYSKLVMPNYYIVALFQVNIFLFYLNWPIAIVNL